MNKFLHIFCIKYLGIIGLFLFYLKAEGQDLHYSQFYNSPQNLNPSHVGVFNGDHRFLLSMRDQWRFVPVPWFTFSGAYDRQFYLKDRSKQFFGGGINFNHDRQGDSKLNLTSLNFSGAYHRILSPNHIVSGGLVLGFATRGFNTDLLTWDKQWDGDAFNAQAPSGELFENLERVYFFETGLGLNYRYQKSSRSHIDIGVSSLHIIQPTTAFYDVEDTKLPRRYTITGVGNGQISDDIDIQLHFLQQIQGPYKETVFGGLAKLHLSHKRGKEFQVHAGVGYRTARSLFPVLAIQYNNYYASLSYDIDSNEFNRILSTNKGGPEIHFRYIISNVKPLNASKVCPIY